MRRLRIRLLLGLAPTLLLGALLQGCTLVGSETPAAPRPPTHPVSDDLGGWMETGIASWYGEPFHGRATASGEIYDMNRLTAAHPTLPFGTRIQVENLDNGQTITLRINDRGPFTKNRILDVSRRAAEELDMVGPGTARVRLRVLEAGGGRP